MPVSVQKYGMPTWASKLRTGCVVALLAAFIYVIMPRFPDTSLKKLQVSCLSNLKQMSYGMLSYAQDNDDKFPPAEEWMETIKIQHPQTSEGGTVYHCPSAPDEPDVYGYAYNSNVAAKPTAGITAPAEKMLVYDSKTLTRNASAPGTSLPPEARHSKGNNIAFSDGHAKWFRSGNESDRGKAATSIPGVTP